MSMKETNLKQLEAKAERFYHLKAQSMAYHKKLQREQNGSIFKKACSLFSFPFGRGAFGALFSAIAVVCATILFANCSFFILIAVIFCGLVDFLYIPLYAVFFPFACLFYLIAKPFRVKRFQKIWKQAEQKLKRCDIQAIEREIAKQKPAGSSCSLPRTSGVEQTEWYKNKVDEYYRKYMGFPPKEENLSTLATDVTLDLHPGDY